MRFSVSNDLDFAAHSNYVELCLRTIGQREPESGLSDVFAYVGDAATVTTAAGPAPPLVTGSFGPLDLSVPTEKDIERSSLPLR